MANCGAIQWAGTWGSEMERDDLIREVRSLLDAWSNGRGIKSDSAKLLVLANDLAAAGEHFWCGVAWQLAERQKGNRHLIQVTDTQPDFPSFDPWAIRTRAKAPARVSTAT